VITIVGATRVGDPTLLLGIVAASPAFDAVAPDADGLILVRHFGWTCFGFQRGAAGREHRNGRIYPGYLAVVGVAVKQHVERRGEDPPEVAGVAQVFVVSSGAALDVVMDYA
jgi:hypothetical protein